MNTGHKRTITIVNLKNKNWSISIRDNLQGEAKKHGYRNCSTGQMGYHGKNKPKKHLQHGNPEKDGRTVLLKEDKGEKISFISHQIADQAVSEGMRQLEGSESIDDIRKTAGTARMVSDRTVYISKGISHTLKTGKELDAQEIGKKCRKAGRGESEKQLMGQLRRKKAEEKLKAERAYGTAAKEGRQSRNSSGEVLSARAGRSSPVCEPELKISGLPLKGRTSPASPIYEKPVNHRRLQPDKADKRITDKDRHISIGMKKNRLSIAGSSIGSNGRTTGNAGGSVKQRMLGAFFRKRKRSSLMLGIKGNFFYIKPMGLLVQAAMNLLKAFSAFLLSLLLLFSPVMIIVVVMYDCPLSLFLPIYETEESEPGVEVSDVVSDERALFNEEVQDLKQRHPGCDKGKIVYDGAEGMGAFNNTNDIIAAYMCRHGMQKNAAIINAETRADMAGVVRDMCQYTTETDAEVKYHYDKDGNIKDSYEVKTLVIHVACKGIGQMKTEYGFTEEQREFADIIMSVLGGNEPGSLIGNKKPGIPSGENPEGMDEGGINNLLGDIDDEMAKKALAFALDKVGYPYSQELRDDGKHYDCSSLVYYAWKNAGINISYMGSNTAADEAKGLKAQSQTFQYDKEKLQPGDLIFWSYLNNDRFMNISHVAIYAGDGKIVQAIDEARGVQMTEIWDEDKIVLCGRPKK